MVSMSAIAEPGPTLLNGKSDSVVLPPPDTDKLRQERSTWERHKSRLMTEALGKYVVIKGEEVSELFFDSHADALSWGYNRYGHVAMLVRHITPDVSRVL